MSKESLGKALDDHPALYWILRRTAAALRPVSYLEIGVREGDSLATVLEASEGSIRHLALCDIWEGEGGYGRTDHSHIEKLLGDMGYDGTVEFYDGDSRLTVPKIPGTFDMALVDGDHMFQGVQIDLKNVWPKVRVGGILVADDLRHKNHPHMEQLWTNWVAEVGAKEVDRQFDKTAGTACCRKVKPLGWEEKLPAEKTAVVMRFGGLGDVVWATPIWRQLKQDGYKVVLHTYEYAAPIVERDPNIDELYVHGLGQVTRQVVVPKDARMVDLIHLGHLLEGGYYFGCAEHSQRYELGCQACAELKRIRDEDIGDQNYEENMLLRADQHHNPYKPTIYFTEEEETEASTLAYELGWNDKFVVIWSAAATVHHKIYPYWFEVCEEFTRLHPEAWVYSVGPVKCSGFQAAGERIVPVTGEWPLRKSVLMGTFANLIVGTETGYMSCVAHYNIPKIVLLSHSSPTNLTKNWPNCTTLQPDVPCHPCHQMHFSVLSCPVTRIKVKSPHMDAAWPICMAEGIKPQVVLDHMERIWQESRATSSESVMVG